MLAFLRESGRASERKSMLFICGGVRVKGPLLPPAWQHVERLEQYADGEITRDELDVASGDADRYSGPAITAEGVRRLQRELNDKAARARECCLLRCIFGNPFRPSSVAASWPAWNEGTVRRLAEAAYNERQLPAGTLDVARIAVLADALEEAGCTEAGLLDHLRGSDFHVRGCYVLDLLLDRE
jgi:hypothetical protein